MTQVSSLYLHVPFCRHLCNYCDFYKRKLDDPIKQFEEFHQFLRESVNAHHELFREQNVSWAPLESIYLGGGTPSLWGKEGANTFQEIVPQKHAESCEFTMEVDPGTWTPELLEAWKKIGLNRISIGTQTLDPNFLQIMDRIHSLEESHKLLTYCDQNNWNFSLDFLLGIPYSKEKKRNIQTELDELLKHNPKHISLYILNARSKYPHITQMPDDLYIREEYLFVSDYLRSKGFHHYEVSNFALPGYESLHNKKYWRSESVAALGPTGTGLLNFGKDHALRYKWKVTKPDFEREILGNSELHLEKMYLELRTSEGWKPEILTPELQAVFEGWQHKNYGEFTQGKMKLNSQGFVILDSLLDDIFRISGT